MDCEINALKTPVRLYRLFLALTALGVLLVACPQMVDAGGLPLPYHWQIRADAQSAATIRDSVPGSNTIIDLRVVGDDVWAATQGGVSHYIALDDEWEIATTADSLATDGIPAILYIDGSHIWAATSHDEVVEGSNVPYGDGLFLSMDGGQSWMEASPDNNQASGPASLCYDFTSFRGNIAAACFAGGLVISGDDGQSWENIFYSRADSLDYVNLRFLERSNRYFSAVVDTTIEDSLILYAGTADGIIKYVYLDSALVLHGDRFNDVATDGRNVYVATNRGLSFTSTSSTNWLTWYTNSGLTTNRISQVMVSGDTVIAGVDSVDVDAGAGLVISTDAGETWTAHAPEQTLGRGRHIKDIITAAGAIWVACGGGGLIRSEDLGQTWTNIFPDSALAEDFRDNTLPGSLKNYVNTLTTQAVLDTTYLFAGTDSGYVLYIVPGDSLPDTAGLDIVGEETAGLGRRVIGFDIQTGTVDGDVLWAWTDTIPGVSGFPGYAVSTNFGVDWRVANANLRVRGIGFSNTDSLWIAADNVFYSGEYPDIDPDELLSQPGFQSILSDGVITPPIRDVATEFDSSDDDAEVAFIWVATDSGLAVFNPRSLQWGVLHPNRNPLQPDVRSQFTYEGRDTSDAEEFLSLSGNFVTAVALNRQGNTRWIWAGTQVAGTGQSHGISRSIDGGKTWVVPITGHRVFNFAFDGSNVWAAASEGLLHSPDNGATWDTLRHFIDPESGASIDSLTEIFAVAVVDDEVWVGTENGIAFIDRDDPSNTLRIRRSFQPVTAEQGSGEGGTYATPVPFSPNFHPNGIRIHYTPPVDGPVTISIYDFANREVRIVTDGEQRFADQTYHESDIWDGRNGKGDLVAVGTYFYVIEYSNGDVHWGKMAVIP
ncbi:MAG: hypothetical protein GF341_00945 [candidate division Zixibacteria bacterium]|nr:hypothetical protein [candidate division Zixibacteria bacterium]